MGEAFRVATTGALHSLLKLQPRLSACHQPSELVPVILSKDTLTEIGKNPIKKASAKV